MKYKSLANKKVLVGGISHSANKFVHSFLNDIGIHRDNISLSEDGFEVLEMAKKELFDLIVLDVNVSVIDGITLAKKIREQYPETKLKIVGFMWTESETGGAFDTTLVRPVPKEEFQREILSVFGISAKKLPLE